MPDNRPNILVIWGEPLTRKRTETIDDEILAGAIDFIERQHASGTPFFVW